MLENPTEVFQEVVGVTLPEDFTIQIHQEDSMTAHVVLPPSGMLTEADLMLIAAGCDPYWGCIGVSMEP